MMRAKYIIIFLLIFTSVAYLSFADLAISKYRRWGKIQYYTKITTITPSNNGNPPWNYEYVLPAYLADGNHNQLIGFRAPRILKLNAYLRLYISDDASVVAWEEVSPDDVPTEAKKKLN